MPFPTLGATELIIILVIVLVLFGAGRLADIGGSLGRGIKEFRKSVKDEETAPVPPKADTEKPPGSTS